MNRSFRLLVCVVFLHLASWGHADDHQHVPRPELVHSEPTRLITAEAFDREDSIAPRGKPGWRGGIGTWKVTEGSAEAIEEPPSDRRPRGHEAVCEYVTELRDAAITVEFRMGQSPQIGIVCRDTHQPNHHLVRVMVTRDKVWLQKMDGIGKQTTKEVLQSVPASIDPDAWYRVVMDVSGDQVHATVGPYTVSGKHERFKTAKGRVGIVARGSGARFRNIAVWETRPKP